MPNTYGVPHRARAALERIHSEHHTPPSSASAPGQAGTSSDRRRHTRTKSVVLREYSEEGLLALWSICVNNYRVVPTDNAYDQAEVCWEWIDHKTTGKGGGHDLSVPPFTTEHGYGCISRGTGRAKIKVYQLAVWVRTREYITHGMNASHLCHNPICMRPEHLCSETAHVNNSRVACPSWKYVPGTDGRTRQRACPHHPACVRPDRKGLAQKGRRYDPHSERGWSFVDEEKENANSNQLIGVSVARSAEKRKRDEIVIDDDDDFLYV